MLATVQQLLYADEIHVRDLLRDLDIVTVLDDIIIESMARGTILMKNHMVNNCIAIFDKLAARATITDILLSTDVRPDTCGTTLVIHHDLGGGNDVLALYARTGAYNVLYYDDVRMYEISGLGDAVRNGLRVRNLKITSADNVDMHDIDSCTSLTKLDAEDTRYITCKPFAKSLRHLTATHLCNICDNELQCCTAIETLNASVNRHITSCAPFAQTLHTLYANNELSNHHRTCGISDNSLSSCKFITKLYADDNHKITTCKPFAKSLKVLHAYNFCGINDSGLSSCSLIEELDASDNQKIKTCDSFAHTLKILYAYDLSGITDNGLIRCASIRELYVSNNKNITTCAPFARTLKILEACNATCGITDEGLKLCTKIRHLYSTDNNRITTCAPFAKSIIFLQAVTGGIRDDGIKLCVSIERLRVLTVTTCVPFVRTLIELYALSSCGIGDAALVACHCIAKLCASHNPHITTCAPFAKSLRELLANGETCGICTEGLSLCRNLTYLSAIDNTKIDGIHMKLRNKNVIFVETTENAEN